MTGAADVRVTVASVATVVSPGQRAGWTITVVNDGPSAARGIVVTGTFPAKLTGVTLTAPNGVTCRIVDATTAVCDLGALVLLPGDANAVVITLTGTVSADSTSTTLNTAATATSTTDPLPANNTDDGDITLGAIADLSITKTGPTGPVTAGGSISWTITVTNAGPSTARNVVVVDDLPAGVTGVTLMPSTGFTCTAGKPCVLGDLVMSGTATITVTGTVGADYDTTSVGNLATVASDTPDPDGTDNSASVDNTVDTSSDLSISKTGPVAATAGGSISWTITVTADGPSVARNVVVTDDLPTGVSGIALTPSVGSCTAEGRYALGDLAPDAMVTVTVTGTVDATFTGGTLRNAASVTKVTASAGTCTTPENNDPLTCSVGTLRPGEEVTVVVAATLSENTVSIEGGWMPISQAGAGSSR